MKTLFVALVALLFAFFLGCQSSITDLRSQAIQNSWGSASEETFAYKDAFNFKYPELIRLEVLY